MQQVNTTQKASKYNTNNVQNKKSKIIILVPHCVRGSKKLTVMYSSYIRDLVYNYSVMSLRKVKIAVTIRYKI